MHWVIVTTGSVQRMNNVNSPPSRVVLIALSISHCLCSIIVFVRIVLENNRFFLYVGDETSHWIFGKFLA